MKKIWSIHLEADSGTALYTCIEACSCSDAINIALEKHGKLFPHLKSID